MIHFPLKPEGGKDKALKNVSPRTLDSWALYFCIPWQSFCCFWHTCTPGGVADALNKTCSLCPLGPCSFVLLGLVPLFSWALFLCPLGPCSFVLLGLVPSFSLSSPFIFLSFPAFVHVFLHVPFCSSLCGPVWPCFTLCGPVWSCLALCGPVWPCLALSGPVWPCLALFGSSCPPPTNKF